MQESSSTKPNLFPSTQHCHLETHGSSRPTGTNLSVGPKNHILPNWEICRKQPDSKLSSFSFLDVFYKILQKLISGNFTLLGILLNLEIYRNQPDQWSMTVFRPMVEISIFKPNLQTSTINTTYRSDLSK